MEDPTPYVARPQGPAEPPLFLSLAANYLICPHSESTALMDDAALFLESARDVLTTIAGSLEGEARTVSAHSKSVAAALYGVCCFIDMAASNVSAVNRRLIRTNGDEGAVGVVARP